MGFSIPSGSNSFGLRYARRVCPVAFCTAAESIYVAEVLYWKCEPGLNGTGCARNVFVQTSSALRGGSAWCPVFMRRRSLIRIAFRFALGLAGASPGKSFITSSSKFSFPSAMAMPTAVEVKLLLSE